MHPNDYNQKEANEIYEGMDFEPAYRVSENLLIFYFTMFIIPMYPIAPLIALIGILINQQLDKYILLKKCRRPIFLSGELGIGIVYIISAGWINYLLGMVLFTFNMPFNSTKSNVKMLIFLFFTGFGLLIENVLSTMSTRSLQEETVKRRSLWDEEDGGIPKAKDEDLDVYKRNNPVYSDLY